MKEKWDKKIEDYLGKKLYAGLDEAGRGSLIGPIVVAAVIMPILYRNDLIKDSKIISKKQREKAFEIIKKEAIDVSIVFVTKEDIEKKNPSEATKDGFFKSINNLKIKPDLCLIDGKEIVNIDKIASLNLIKGESKSINIAAASIIAKVTRDNFIDEIHNKYPEYKWNINKGYANKEHLSLIYKNGICDEFHRKNYEPIKSMVKGKKNKDEIFKKYKIGKSILEN